MAVATGDELQVVTLEDASDGTFTLTYADQTTAAVAFDATAAQVKTALVALSNIGASDVDVTGDAGGPYTVEFKGALKNTNVAVMTADGAELVDGTVAVTTQAQGNVAVVETCYVDTSVANSTVKNLEVLVGQVPPAGSTLVSKADYYS